MKHYIFITTEGYTYQPDSTSIEPDVENCQVLGFGNGSSINEAFESFVATNSWVKETTFNEVIAYEVLGAGKRAGDFFLDQFRS